MSRHTVADLPERVQAMIGVPHSAVRSDNAVSRANIHALCAAVENANPVYWDADSAKRITGADIAPTAMLSVWARPELWSPGVSAATQALQLHYDLKEIFAFPTAIVVSFESVFYVPVRIGDRLHSQQLLQSVSEETDTRLGRGRFWNIEMRYYNQDDALAGIDKFNCLGYRKTDKQ